MKNAYSKLALLGLAMGISGSAAIGQTGPGGVSATGASTNLKLWLSADRGVYTNAGTTAASNSQSIQQWNDFSGNSSNAVNIATSSTRPVLTTGGPNGMPVLSFTPGSQQTIGAPVNISPGSMADLTIIAVAMPNAVNTTLAKLWGHDAGGYNRSVGFDGRGTVPFVYFTGSGVANYTTPTVSSYFISTANYSTTAFAGYFNGAIAGSGGVSIGNGNSTLSIGSITPTSEFWNGTIAEFIVYNKVLSEAERVLVENYLAAKYGLSLTGIDFYAQDKPVAGNFDYEVAGIGAGSSGAAVTSGQGSGIVRMSAPSAMVAGEYLMFGHDNLPLTMSGSNRPAGFNSRLQRTWRSSETGEVGTINVSFDLTGVSGTPALASDYALIIDRNNNGLFSDETPVTTGVITGGSLAGSTITFSAVDINDNQRFSLAFTNTVALPVDLLSFTAAAAGAQNEIRWEMSNARSIAGLEVERSDDGTAFSTLSRVSPSEDGRYSTADNAAAAITYYRLRILEHDGSSSFSNTLKVMRQDRSGVVRISPNPSNDIVQVAGLPGTAVTIRIIDLSGSVLIAKQSSEKSASISLAGLAAGNYLICVDADGLQVVKHLVKL